MFDPDNYEDEPCRFCGAKPSVSEGHGAMTCKPCFDSQWCKTCGYQLYKDHDCVAATKNAVDSYRRSLANAELGAKRMVREARYKLARALLNHRKARLMEKSR